MVEQERLELLAKRTGIPKHIVVRLLREDRRLFAEELAKGHTVRATGLVTITPSLIETDTVKKVFDEELGKEVDVKVTERSIRLRTRLSKTLESDIEKIGLTDYKQEEVDLDVLHQQINYLK